MKSAATFLTLGHRMRAIIVSRLPNIPASIIIIVATAANVSNGRENLKRRERELKRKINGNQQQGNVKQQEVQNIGK